MQTILTRIIYLLLLALLSLHAEVVLIAKKEAIVGEPYTFEIEARGFDIALKSVEKIDSYWVEEIKREEELIIIGVLRGKKITQHLRLIPKKDFRIPSFDILVDGRHEKTKAQDIHLKQASKSHIKGFDLQANLSQDHLFLGESTSLKLTFNYQELEDYEILPPHIQNSFIKEISDKEIPTKQGYENTLIYTLTPKKSGTLRIPAQKATITQRIQGKRQTFDIYSNPLTLNVKILPKDISLIGNYALRVWTDTNRTQKDTPTILHLKVQGEGNLKDLDAIKIHIPHTTIFSTPTIKKDHSYEKRWKILSDKDFTIPSLSLSFWDKKKRKTRTQSSTPINITITDSIQKGLSMQEKLFYTLLGAIMIALWQLLAKKYRERKKETNPQHHWREKLLQAKTNDDFFALASRMIGKDNRLDRMIYRLETSDEKAFKEVKKEILKYLKG